MKNILITGGTSFIGVHIIKECLKKGYTVTTIIRPDSKNSNRLPKNNLLKIIELDMSEVEKVLEIVKEKEFDIFYHLAWEGARVPYRDNETLQRDNYKYALNAMKVAKQLNCKLFIGSGSQAEYGKCTGEIDEEYTTNPTTEYGRYKLKAYQDLKELANKLDIKFMWTRIFSVYGIYDYPGTLIMTALDKMSRNEDIPLTQCVQNWDYVHVEDAARAMCLLGEVDCEEGVYNIASGENRPLKEFIIDMKRITNSKSELKFGEVPYNSEGIISFKPIIDKLKKNVGWAYQIGFEDGIRTILDYMK